MTATELREHIARLGGPSKFSRALPCSRTSARRWAGCKVNVTAAWAARIRALPTPPPKAAKAALIPAVDPRQLPLPMGMEAAAPRSAGGNAEVRA